jgi:predicted nuclease with TOPRIM domain
MAREDYGDENAQEGDDGGGPQGPERGHVRIAMGIIRTLLLAAVVALVGFVWDMHGNCRVVQSRLDHAENHVGDLQRALIDLQRQIAEIPDRRSIIELATKVSGMEEYFRSDDKEMERLWEKFEKLRDDLDGIIARAIKQVHPDAPIGSP